jgi:hypothetical protein
MAASVSRGIPSAGIFAGPAAWLIDTQANYALVPWVCASRVPAVPLVAAAMFVLALVGAFLSWRAYATVAGSAAPDSPHGGRPHRFTALIGIAMALLFAVVILVQGAAGIVFHGCER